VRAVLDPPPEPVSLDRAVEPWVGRFPGLGTVLVHDDGRVEVDVEPVAAGPDDDPGELARRAAALRHGWGEPLALARRGFDLYGGGAATPPGGERCLLVSGEPRDVGIVLARLARRGWSVLADRVVPARWEGDVLVAYPRQAPTLVGQALAEALELGGEPARAGSDAVVVELPRGERPTPVAAVASLLARRPDRPVLEALRGHEAFEAATHLVARGALAPDPRPGPAERMAADLRLAALPLARLHLARETSAADVVELCGWWRDATGEPVGTPPASAP
jgi:hypothetical protein